MSSIATWRAEIDRVLEPRHGARLRRLLNLLSRAAFLPHSRSSLLAHLCGTWRILHQRGSNESTCLAGLLHSAYSTEFYPHGLFTLDQRQSVADATTPQAERLVYLFCTLHKQTIWPHIASGACFVSAVSRLDGRDVELSREEALALLQIECANHIEQCSEPDGSPRPFLSWYAGFVTSHHKNQSDVLSAARALTDDDERSSIKHYGRFIRYGHAVSFDDLDEATRLNPWAAELQLFSALRDVSRGDHESAALRLNRATLLLRTWSTAWDKRLPLMAWKGLIRRIRHCGHPGDALPMVSQIVRGVRGGG